MNYDEEALSEWFDNNFKVKLSWNDAPEWANWLVIGHNGGWYWFENKPNINNETKQLDFNFGNTTNCVIIEDPTLLMESRQNQSSHTIENHYDVEHCDKPSWNDAPEWANWLAMDDDGCWYWHKNEPNMESGGWYSDSRSEIIKINYDYWTTTLEKKPAPEVLPGQIWSFGGIEYSIKEVNQKQLFAKNDAGFYWSGKSEDFVKIFKLVQTKN